MKLQLTVRKNLPEKKNARSKNLPEKLLSNNNPCFPCNIVITNFRILYTCKIRFYGVIYRTARMFAL